MSYFGESFVFFVFAQSVEAFLYKPGSILFFVVEGADVLVDHVLLISNIVAPCLEKLEFTIPLLPSRVISVVPKVSEKRHLHLFHCELVTQQIQPNLYINSIRKVLPVTERYIDLSEVELPH